MSWAPISKATESEAEAAGEAAAKWPNTQNCHFRFFATPELSAAWSRGKARGETALAGNSGKEGA